MEESIKFKLVTVRWPREVVETLSMETLKSNQTSLSVTCFERSIGPLAVVSLNLNFLWFCNSMDSMNYRSLYYLLKEAVPGLVLIFSSC